MGIHAVVTGQFDLEFHILILVIVLLVITTTLLQIRNIDHGERLVNHRQVDQVRSSRAPQVELGLPFVRRPHIFAEIIEPKPSSIQEIIIATGSKVHTFEKKGCISANNNTSPLSSLGCATWEAVERA